MSQSPLQKLQKVYNWTRHFRLQPMPSMGTGMELSIRTTTLIAQHNRTVARLKLSLEIDYLTTSIGIVTRRSWFNQTVSKQEAKRDEERLDTYYKKLELATAELNKLIHS